MITLSKNKKNFIGILIVVTVIVSIFLILGYGNHTTNNTISLQSKQSETILRELNHIRVALHDAENSSGDSKSQKATLQKIENNILSIQKSMLDIAKTSDIQGISKEIISIKDDVNLQISDLKKIVSSSLGNKNYIDASELPFHIVSIDVISGQSYVSVNYANHISPLSTGDVIAGWRMTGADFDTNTVEFSNEKNQFVQVTPQGM